MWYIVAAANGSKQSPTNVSALKQRMPPQQIDAAESMARQCLESQFVSCGEKLVENSHPPAEGGTSTPNSPNSQPPGSSQLQQKSGSGFFVSAQGHILTNFHVVDGCETLKVSSSDRLRMDAAVVQVEKVDDLALLKVNTTPSASAEFRGSARLVQGETVTAYGFPLVGTLSSSGNVSSGLITALAGLRNNARELQISVPVQPGNSGGPLADQSGAVVGIVSSKLDALKTAKVTQDIPQNVSFAIKASAAIDLLSANNVDYKVSEATAILPTTELTRRLREYTIFIECN